MLSHIQAPRSSGLFGTSLCNRFRGKPEITPITFQIIYNLYDQALIFTEEQTERCTFNGLKILFIGLDCLSDYHLTRTCRKILQLHSTVANGRLISDSLAVHT